MELQLIGVEHLHLSIAGRAKFVVGHKAAKAHVVMLIGIFGACQRRPRSAFKLRPLMAVGQVDIQGFPGAVRIEEVNSSRVDNIVERPELRPVRQLLGRYSGRKGKQQEEKVYILHANGFTRE